MARDGSGTVVDPRQDAATAFVERFAADLTEIGMQRMAARVFACLFVDESGSLTSAELAERLQASPAAISGAVRYLSQIHMVSREREPGSRRERYRAHTDTWYEAVAGRDIILRRWQSTFKAGIAAMGADHPGSRRLAEAREFMAYMQRELDGLMRRWYAHLASLRDGTGTALISENIPFPEPEGHERDAGRERGRDAGRGTGSDSDSAGDPDGDSDGQGSRTGGRTGG